MLNGGAHSYEPDRNYDPTTTEDPSHRNSGPSNWKARGFRATAKGDRPGRLAKGRLPGNRVCRSACPWTASASPANELVPPQTIVSGNWGEGERAWRRGSLGVHTKMPLSLEHLPGHLPWDQGPPTLHSEAVLSDHMPHPKSWQTPQSTGAWGSVNLNHSGYRQWTHGGKD